MSFGVVALSALIAAFAPGTTRADPPQPADGDFVVDQETFNVTSVEPAGAICLIELTATFQLTGTFEGEFTADFFIVHLGPCEEPAPQVFIAEGTYTGAVGDAQGSFDFRFVGDIDAEGNADGDLVVVRGTGDLKGLSSRITLTGQAGVAGTYAGRIHFAR